MGLVDWGIILVGIGVQFIAMTYDRAGWSYCETVLMYGGIWQAVQRHMVVCNMDS